MVRRTRQISLKECYDILHLEKGADLQAVKTAYRRRAFELHPDLHPGDPEAGRQFQLLNEAYVALSAMLKPAEEARQKGKAQASAEQPKADAEQKTRQEKNFEDARTAYAEQDVLRDLLNDPFARRVFEDIYSELGRKQETAPPPPPPPPPPPKDTKKAETAARAPTPPPQPHRPKKPPVPEKGVAGAVKGWLRKQLDEEQSLTMPAAALGPGRKIRLQIRPSMSEDVKPVEVTLPSDFVVGKPLRLKGLGKRIGPWQGDLYLTLYSA